MAWKDKFFGAGLVRSCCLLVAMWAALTGNVQAAQFAYVANYGANSISAYSINSTTGALTVVAVTPSGSQPISISLDPKGRFAYAANSGSNNVSVFSVNQTSGALTATSTAAAGASPNSIAVDPSGRFAYVANNYSNNISVYSINQSTGALAQVTTVASASGPYSIAVEPGGRFVYVTNMGANIISSYAINQSTGALTAKASADTGSNPRSLLIDPNGKAVYVTNSGSGTVSAYDLDLETGAFGLRVPVAADAGAYSISASSGSVFAYVVNFNASTVSPYIMASRQLVSAVNKISTEKNPVSARVDASGQFLYVASVAPDTLTVYKINKITGELGAGSKVNALSSPQSLITLTTSPAGSYITLGVSSPVVSDTTSYSATVSGYMPSGTVNFKENGVSIDGCSAVALVSGMAQCDKVYTNAGYKAISVEYSGSVSYAPSSVTVSNGQYIALRLSALPDGLIRQAYSSKLTVQGSNGPYTVSLASGALPDGLSLSTSGTLSGTPTSSGSFQFILQARDANGLSGQASYKVVIASRVQTVTFGAAPGLFTSGSGTISATASSGLVVSFSSLTPAVCTVSGTTVKALVSGTCNILATQGGTDRYDAAAPVTLSIKVESPRYAYALSPNGFISGYSITPGTHALVSIGTAATGQQPVSMSMDPLGHFVYVANQGSNTISTYAANSASGLLIAGRDVSSDIFPCAVAVHPNGRFLYVSSDVAKKIGTYQINQDTGALTASAAVGDMPGACSMRIDSTGRFMYLIDSASSKIITYTINQQDGTLILFSSLAVNSNPQKLIVEPSGRFAYVVYFDRILGYKINQDDGSLMAMDFMLSIYGVNAMVADATGKFIYASTWVDNRVPTVLTYLIDQVSGTLKAAAMVNSISYPWAIQADPGEQVLYVVGYNAIFPYAVNPTTGELTLGGTTATTTAEGQRGLALTTARPAVSFVTLSSSAPSSLVGAPVSLRARVLAYSASGTMSFTSNGVPIAGCGAVALVSGTAACSASFPTLGNRVIAVDYSGDTFRAASSATLDGGLTVMFNLSALPDGTVGNAYSNAIIVGGGASAPATFAVSAGALPSGLTLSTVGVLSGTPLASGKFNFTLSATDAKGYSGLRAYAFTIAGLSQSITLGAVPSLVFNGKAILSASATSGLPVTFSSSTPTICNVQGATVTAIQVGNCVIVATQAGNAANDAAPSVTQTIAVGKASQTIINKFVSPASFALGGSATITGQSSSGLAVSFSSLSSAICSVTGAVVSGVSAGNCLIAVNQAGNDNFAPAAQVTQAVSITPAVYGRVTDLATGTPISGVRVTLTGGASAVTDFNGYYQLAGVAPGVYAITFVKSAYPNASLSNLVVGLSGTLANAQLSAAGPLNITSTGLLHAESGASYNDGIRATGGSWPYVFSIIRGRLPDGLNLDTVTGDITGTPVRAGAYTFLVGLKDKAGSTAEREFNLEVTQPLVISTATALKRGTLGVDYFDSMLAKGGTLPYIWAAISASMPPGLVFASNGSISGKPSALGATQFPVSVTDASGRLVTQNVRIEVVMPLQVTSTRLNDGVAGAAYTQPLSATGGYGSYRWAVYAGALPSGLTLDSQSGIIAGTPTTATRGIIVFSVADDDGRLTYRDYLLTITKPLKIPAASVPDGLKFEKYSEAIRLDGGIAPYAFSYAGQLPAGIQLDSANGILSGTPTAAGLTNLNVTVVDSTWPTPQTVTQPLGIRITSVLTVTTSAVLPQQQKGRAISPIVLVAKGGASPYTWGFSGGNMPPGLALNPQTGELSGTPSERGDFVFQVKVSDNAGATALKEFFWHVSDTLVISTIAVDDGAAGMPYSVTLNASGGLPAYAWRLKSGTLPTGLSLNGATGTIIGTPVARQQFSFTLEISDADSPAQKAERTYVMEVRDTLFIATPTLPNGRLGSAYSATVTAQLGTPPYAWRLLSGVLPPGLVLTGTPTVATIQGTPTASGVNPVLLEVSDSGTPVKTATRTLSLQVSDNVTIGSGALKTATRGAAYSDLVRVSGGSLPYVYAISFGALPAGLTLNPLSGEISGSASGLPGSSAVFKVRVTDAGDPAASVEKDLVIYVIDPLAITSAVIQGALLGAPYQVTLVGSGGFSTYAWSIQSGALPRGLQLDASTGVIAGSAAECGVFSFTVQLADAAPVPNLTRFAYDLAVQCINGTLPGASNIVKLSGRRADYTLVKSGTDYLLTDTTGKDAARTVAAGKRLRFADAAIALDVEGDGIAGATYRLYRAAFNRVPDQGGLGYWMAVLDNGGTLDQVATSFIASAEFKSLYGASPTNAALVNALYSNVLHRTPDPGGLDYWTGVLASGGSVSTVLVAFSNSPENRSQTSIEVAGGIAYTPYGEAARQSAAPAARAIASPTPMPTSVLPTAVPSVDVAVVVPTHYTGWWQAADGSGQGVDLSQDGVALELRWQAFDGDGLPVWYLLRACVLTDSVCMGSLLRLTMPKGISPVAMPAGTATLQFIDADSALLSARLDGADTRLALRRAQFGRGRYAPDIDYSGLWRSADGGATKLALTQQYDMLALSWYGYDASGTARWYQAPSCQMADSVCVGELFELRREPAQPDLPQASATVEKVGDVRVTFGNDGSAMLTFSVRGQTVQMELARKAP